MPYRHRATDLKTGKQWRPTQVLLKGAAMPKAMEAVLEAAVPILSVADVSEALDYYGRVLGFQVGWTWGEPVHLASVCRNRVECGNELSFGEATAS